MAKVTLQCPLCRNRVNQNEEKWEDYYPGERDGQEVRFAMGKSDGPGSVMNVREIVGFVRLRKCSACGKIWRSVEIPNDWMDALFRFVNRQREAVSDLGRCNVSSDYD